MWSTCRINVALQSHGTHAHRIHSKWCGLDVPTVHAPCEYAAYVLLLHICTHTYVRTYARMYIRTQIHECYTQHFLTQTYLCIVQTHADLATILCILTQIHCHTTIHYVRIYVRTL